MSRVAYTFRATVFILVNIRHATQPLQKRKDIIRSLTAAQHAAQLVIRANDACHRITKPALAGIWEKCGTASTTAK
jgi:hypothetical protein